MGETRSPLPLPCPQSPAVWGTFWPSQQHIQEIAGIAPSPNKDPQVMVLMVLVPLWPSTGGGRGAGTGGAQVQEYPRSLQSTRNSLTLAMTSRVGARQAWEWCPPL